MSWQTPERRHLGLLPRTLLLEHLGGVHPADPGVQRGDRERLAPFARRLGPLVGPAEVDQLVAGVEQPAVDGAGPHGRERVGQGGGHRLVEQGQALLDLGLLDPRPAFEEDAEGDQRLVAEAPAEVLHPPGRRHGVVEVDAHQPGGLQVQRIAVLGALGLVGQDSVGP